MDDENTPKLKAKAEKVLLEQQESNKKRDIVESMRVKGKKSHNQSTYSRSQNVRGPPKHGYITSAYRERIGQNNPTLDEPEMNYQPP